VGLTVRHIATRFALLLTIVAIVPLVIYGIVSILSLQTGTRDSVVNGDLNVATRAAEEIRRYISTNAELLKALAADLQETRLDGWQQDRILKNYILEFREFREITLFDESGQSIATSRVDRSRVKILRDAPRVFDAVMMSPLKVDEDLLPTTTFAVRLRHLDQPAGWLVGEFSLEEMWRMVDRIRIGEHGFAMVVGPGGELLAHGDPDKKALIAQARRMGSHPLVLRVRDDGDHAPVWQEYVDDEGHRNLGVAAAIAPLGWTVIVEQPTAEAYATAAQLQRQLVVAISIALLAMVSVGYLFGRSFITPIHALQRGTQAIAAGQLNTRVTLESADEFAELGDAFNTMANRLVELQENVKRQERQAMFGRIAAGLVHDLAHPIMNIDNSARLLVRHDMDADSRVLFHRTIERELSTLKRFIDDLRNLVKPKPIERFAVEVNGSVAEIVESMRADGERAGVVVESRYGPEPLVIEGDRFALGRVFRNLITNAIQATRPGGHVTITTAAHDGGVEIDVTDDGTGIPADRLSAIFEDFVTTKHRGLGLGLAISKRIVEQLGGTIAVKSVVGSGTTFIVRFPLAKDECAAQTVAS
jgi:signal transduction histidine kinase